MKKAYIRHNFGAYASEVVRVADQVCQSYAKMGYGLTLRQLYYWFVKEGLIPNRGSEYDKLGGIIDTARKAGLIDWDHIEDRTRNLSAARHFIDPDECIRKASKSYVINRWYKQKYKVEVWVEKEALAGIVGQAALRFDCPFFACRGYVSQSEMHIAGRRLAKYRENGYIPVIVHLGDHDPSGIHMSEDIENRLSLYMGDGVLTDDQAEGERIPLKVDRVALNMDQVRQYNPPPNPAKVTDSRAADYIRRFGRESWELDALSPQQLDALVVSSIKKYLDIPMYNARVEKEREGRALIEASAVALRTHMEKEKRDRRGNRPGSPGPSDKDQ